MRLLLLVLRWCIIRTDMSYGGGARENAEIIPNRRGEAARNRANIVVYVPSPECEEHGLCSV